MSITAISSLESARRTSFHELDVPDVEKVGIKLVFGRRFPK